jgi:hypothetical protein
LRTFGFLSDGDGVVTNPHQSPFWIQALGLPFTGDRLPGPWLLAAPEIPQFPAMAKCCGSRFIEAARERSTLFVHRERVATLRSLFTDRWLLPVGRSNPLLVS